MRRKSERVKDKDKPSEKKIDKSPKKSRRSSRRRKKSSSSSEDSETDEYDNSFKSCKYDSSFKSCKDDAEEEIPTDKNVPEKNKSTYTDVDTKDPALSTDLDGKERRHSKKQTADETKENPDAENAKEGSVERTDTPVDNVDKHKESESKSLVWQVKSTDCSGGEINKLKLRIVRPAEPVEPEPRKRKKLSRMPHRESEFHAGESEEGTTHDSQDEKHKSRKPSSSSDESKKRRESSQEKQRPDESLDEKQKPEEHSEEQKKPEESSKEKEKPEDSSDEEQQKLDSSDAAPESVETSRTAEKMQEDPQVSKLRRKESEDRIKESEVTSGNAGEKGSPVDNNVTDSLATVSSDRTDSCKPEPSASVENVSAEEDAKPHSSSEASPRRCPVSAAETNVCSSDNKGPGVGSLLEGKKLSGSSDESRVVCKALEEKSTVPDSESNVSGKARDRVSSSDSRESSVKDSKSKSHDLTKERAVSHNATENKTTVRKSSEAKSTSHDSSDSEEERISYRKQQESKKKTHRLARHTSDPPEKKSGVSGSLKITTSTVETSHKSYDTQNSSKSTNKHADISKESKGKEGSKDSPRLERRKHKSTTNPVSLDRPSADKPQVKEKVSLKRSFSRATDASASSLVPSKDGGVNAQDGETLEGRTTSTENTQTTSDVPTTRKRRWGASKSTAMVKKPTLSISSDSLKHLIPEVKPLPMSEVQLTEDEDEEEEGEVVDKTEESFEIEAEVKNEKHRDEGVITNNRTDEKEHLYPLPMVLTPPEGKSGTLRKISIVSADAPHLQRSPSPARHRASNILFITNLVRPFTVNQLRELLARTGSIVDNGFWIDKIKSKCYVQYETETEAKETRHALHGVRWPVSNPKQLCVDYAKKEDMDLARDLAEGNHIPRKTEPLKMERIDGWLADQGRDKGREQPLREERNRDRDRERVRGKDRHQVGAMEVMEKSREAKVPISIREWDLGKMDMESFEERGFRRDERVGGERERRTRKERSHRSPSREAPGRKIRKKDEEAPAKLLDDLFKKTKVTPCVYWLPLTADQIVVKEEMRRKHMAEHERRMAEMRKAEKAERERHRARIQGRTSQRRFDERDKRRHRSPSSSPKK